jgi:hypothetical protein
MGVRRSENFIKKRNIGGSGVHRAHQVLAQVAIIAPRIFLKNLVFGWRADFESHNDQSEPPKTQQKPTEKWCLSPLFPAYNLFLFGDATGTKPAQREESRLVGSLLAGGLRQH